MSESHADEASRRRYLRIPSVVPIDYQFLKADNVPVHPDIRTAFTRDLTAAGLCLQVSTLPESAEEALAAVNAPPRIVIDLALPTRRLRIAGRVAWVKPAAPGTKEHLVGVEFLGINDSDAQEILRFAQRATRRPAIWRSLLTGLAVATLLAVGIAYWNHRERTEQLGRAGAALKQVSTEYNETSADLHALSSSIRSLSAEVDALAAALAAETGDTPPPPTDDPTARDSDEPQLVAPPIDDLSSSVDKLKRVVTELRVKAQQGRGAKKH